MFVKTFKSYWWQYRKWNGLLPKLRKQLQILYKDSRAHEVGIWKLWYIYIPWCQSVRQIFSAWILNAIIVKFGAFR